MFSKNGEKDENIKKNISEASKGRALGAASVTEAKVNASREPLAEGQGLELTGIYNVFVRSSKIEKNIRKSNFLKMCISCRRELDS